MAGREAAARVRAVWAARAGIETMIAQLQAEQSQASPLGAKSLLSQLAVQSEGKMGSSGAYVINHQQASGPMPGPVDLHSKLNVNRLTSEDLLLLPNMTEDIAAAIADWIDTDEDVRAGGAEAESYLGLAYPHLPRNGPIVSLLELERVKDVDPLWVRGEDWNQNGILDPNENDGDLSWPPDDADGTLDAGWSEFLTAASLDGGLTSEGEEPLDLTTADASSLVTAFSVDQTQADVISAWAQQQGETGDLAALFEQNLSQIQRDLQQQGVLPTRQGRQPVPTAADLNRDQITAIIDKASLGPGTTLRPGKVNINTVSDETLEYLAQLDAGLRDALILFREQKGGDIASMGELQEVPQVDQPTLATLLRIFCVRSSVFSVTSRGKDVTSGLEVEIVAELDRSAESITVRSLTIR